MQLGRRKGNVTHHATQIIVGVTGLGSAAVLMSVVLSYYLVTLLVRCEARGAGVGSHWAGQQRSNILLSCIDIIDKDVDIILLFCCSFIFLFCWL